MDGTVGIAGDVGLAFESSLRHDESLAQLIQAMAVHSTDSGGFDLDPIAPPPPEFTLRGMLAPA